MCSRLVVFFMCLVPVYCCFGGGKGGEGPDSNETGNWNDTLLENNYDEIGNAYLGAGPESPDWGGVGWGRPPGAGENWGNGGRPPREPGPGEPGYQPPPELDPKIKHIMPENWKGLGSGSGGAAPPQWAYLPKNIGRPTYCFQPPVKGPCRQNLIRYGFNPFLDECQPFPYSGCGANENNFVSRERCNEECTRLPEPDCASIDDPSDALSDIDDFYGNN